MTPARRLLAFAQSQQQNIDNLIQAACKRLFTLETYGDDHTCRGAGRERAAAVNVEVIIPEPAEPGPQAVARADYVLGVQYRGESQAIA